MVICALVTPLHIFIMLILLDITINTYTFYTTVHPSDIYTINITKEFISQKLSVLNFFIARNARSVALTQVLHRRREPRGPPSAAL